MRAVYSFVLLSGFVALLSQACKKDVNHSTSCAELKEGLSTNDVDQVRKSIKNLLTTYSRDNVEALAHSVSQQCSVTAVLDCFECIQTLPAQSEIKFDFDESGVAVEKRLDISKDQNNRIQVLNIHD